MSNARPKRVRVIDNAPSCDQDPIAELIGQEFSVLRACETDEGRFEVTVHSDLFGGAIILNPDEYEKV